MVEIAALADDTTEVTRRAIERIFFASAARSTFVDEAERASFLDRWLGRYLEHEREHAFVARDGNGAVVGYLVGCLVDPAGTARFSDISYVRDFADLTALYPAHLHINLDPAWRSQGIGGQLIAAFAEHATARGVSGVHVVTGAAGRNAGFYRRCGFAPLRELVWNGARIALLGRQLQPPV